MTSPIELVIFDCDGVLVDSERLSIRIDVDILEKLGWPLSEAEVIDRFVGRSEADQMAEVEAHLGRRIGASWDEAFGHLYRAMFDAELRPVEGIPEVLATLARASMPVCVASSGDHAKIRRNLALTHLDGWFGDRIFSSDDVEHGKPAPDLFLHAATSLGAEPAACAVVEDSRHGVEAARAAGMRVFGFAGGVTPGDRLVGPGTVVFEDMRALPGLLGLTPAA